MNKKPTSWKELARKHGLSKAGTCLSEAEAERLCFDKDEHGYGSYKRGKESGEVKESSKATSESPEALARKKVVEEERSAYVAYVKAKEEVMRYGDDRSPAGVKAFDTYGKAKERLTKATTERNKRKYYTTPGMPLL